MMFANVPRFHLENFGSCLQKSQVLGHLRTGHLQHPTVELKMTKNRVKVPRKRQPISFYPK